MNHIGQGTYWLVNKLGPVLVTLRLNDVTCRIRLSKVDTKIVPYEQLKPYRGDTVPKWAKAFRDKLV